jgi:hypothetical protein
LFYAIFPPFHYDYLLIQAWWLISVIPATWNVGQEVREVGELESEDGPGKSKRPYLKKY